MNRFKIAGRLLVLTVVLLLAGTGAGWSATKYGDAIIEKGGMTVIREGRTLKFETLNESVEIVENDLIRVRPASRVVLNSREKASVTLGGNAVFHVKPWQSKGKTGFMRALFGKFRAAVVGLTGGEQFNVRTATATIGVKGTEYRTQVTNRGGTLLLVRESTVGLQGQRGPEVDVNQGFISLTINITPPAPPAVVPPGVEQQFGSDDLDSPNPNSPGAGNFVAEDALLNAGLVDQDTLDEGKGEGGDVEGDEGTPGADVNLEFDPNAARDALQRGRVRLQF